MTICQTDGVVPDISPPIPTRLVPLEEWRRQVREALYEVNISTEEPLVRCDLCNVRFGMVSVTSLAVDPQVVQCSASKSSSDLDRIDFIHVRRGSMEFEHRGQRVHLSRGDSIAVERAAGFVSRNDRMAGTLVSLPMTWFRPDIVDLGSVIGRRISGETGWGRVLGSTLNLLADDMTTATGVSQYLVAEQIRSAFLLASNSQTIPLRMTTRRIVEDARIVIRHTAQDPSTKVETIARRMGISVRLLQKAFAESGSSVAKEIVERRLIRSRALLEDNRFDLVSVADIGFRCGFYEASHFGRRFKARFGVSPGEVRAMRKSAMNGAQPD